MLDRIPLGYYAFAGLLNFLTSFALLIFVFSKNHKSRINQTFCFFAFSVAGWGLSYFLWLITDKSYLAEFYLRTLMVFVIFIPTTFTHFVLTLLKIDHKRINFTNYLISAVLAVTAYTQYFAYDLEPYLIFPYWLRAGPLFYVHAVHFFACAIYSHFLMLHALKGRKGVHRNQILYVLLGTGIGFSGGALNYLTWSRIPVPPFLNPLVSVYVAAVAYSIIRHQLMDIEVVIKKFVVFATLFGAVYGVFVSVTMLTQEFIPNKWVGYLISAVIITLAHGPLKSWLVNVTDKFLFQKKYNPLRMIHDFSEAVLTELDLNRIVKQTLDILSEALRIDSCAIFFPNKEGSKFILKESRGIQGSEISLSDKSELISKLGSASIVTEQTAEMKQLGVVLCVGVSIRKDLIAVLALGTKKSDEDYTQEDTEVLSILADALGVAITNASAYEDLRHKANLVTMGTLAAGIRHDIAKPIGGVSPLAAEYLVRLKKGNFADPVKMLNEGGDLIEQCCDTFQKVLDISETYVARPKEKEKPVLLNVSEQVDAAVGLLQQKIGKNGITIVKRIPDDLPKVLFDRDYIAQILDNIISNAIDAIVSAKRSNEESIIIVSAKEIENRTLNVRLEIKDTGTGIPEKIKEKIFKAWFTTKGKDGTGLGLFLVSDLVLRGGGTIEAESEEGKGTTFILGLKGVRKSPNAILKTQI